MEKKLHSIKMMMMTMNFFFLLFTVISISFFHGLSDAHVDSDSPSTIIFTTVGRSRYAFDIFSLPLPETSKKPVPPSSSSNELRLTDGVSVNFNGHFPSVSSLSRLPGLVPDRGSLTSSVSPPIHLIYVTERNGASEIYLDSLYYRNKSDREDIDNGEFDRIQVPIVGFEQSKREVSMKDKPNLVGEFLVYVSTHENPGIPRTSWTAVYSTHLKTGMTKRLTPYGVADFSPSVSPSGMWTAVASYGEKGWTGDVEELRTDIYLFLTRDGSNRVKIVEHGGWPTWADEFTLYFHRRCDDDGWWSIYRAIIPKNGEIGVDSVVTQRVTPPGFHGFTPSASNKSFIAMATRRPDSEFRHIELFDVVSNRFVELTRPISPTAHHFNPFISEDSSRVGYHKCRGSTNDRKTISSSDLILENVRSPLSGVTLLRFDGSFPSFSPNGDRIAYVNFPGVYVVNSDGSGLRKVFDRNAFSTAWDPVRKGIVYTSAGPQFSSESSRVDIVSINVDDENLSYRTLTTGGENNAFPYPSPDGKWIVFRSGRSGHKNLYIMDASEGEAAGIYRLSEGPWSDTMCTWSPDGEWILFSSDRENPGSGSFELFMVHPNGTGLHKLIQSGLAGRTNHPMFSPDGKYIVFTSDYAGVSAEPISNPHHYQPYGEIFVIKSDGSEIRRLVHNSYEDGTPAWGSRFLKPVNVEWPNGRSSCSFEDCHWLNIKSGNIFRSVTSSSTMQYDNDLVSPKCAAF